MQNLQTNEALLQHFQVEELEERLENKWGNPSTKVCVVATTIKDGVIINNTTQRFPIDQDCPQPRITWGDPIEVNENEE